jgi:glycosyltransferase involved in cell wall biosynthesis
MAGSRKPRVALVAHNVHDRGGMERACAELIRHQHREIDFLVVSAELAPDLRPHVVGWRPVRVPARPFPLKFSVFWFRAGMALRHLDVDLIHTVGAIVPNRIDLATISFCHAGYVAKEHGLVPRGVPPNRWINRAIGRVLALLAERWVYRPGRVRAFGAVSEGVGEELGRHYPDIPYTVTPNGVDLARFHPDPETRIEFRRVQGTAEGTLVALFVGGDWDHKGLNVAIGGVGEARAAGVDVDLWVVGRGDVDRFAALSAGLGAESHVRFYGHREDTQCFYQSADLLVLPSSYETFSLVCFEAAACALPLVIPPVSGAREIVGSEEGGCLVERSALSVAAALTRLAANPAVRSRLGEEARRRAQAYEWARSAQSVLGLYEQLLSS